MSMISSPMSRLILILTICMMIFALVFMIIVYDGYPKNLLISFTQDLHQSSLLKGWPTIMTSFDRHYFDDHCF